MTSFKQLCQFYQFACNTEVDSFCLPCTTDDQQETENGLDTKFTHDYQTELPEVDSDTSTLDESQFYSKDNAEVNASLSNSANEENASLSNLTNVKRAWKKRFYNLYKPLYIRRKNSNLVTYATYNYIVQCLQSCHTKLRK